MLSTETTLRVINTIKVRLLQDLVQSITIILKKTEWRNFYNSVQVLLNAKMDAKMML